MKTTSSFRAVIGATVLAAAGVLAVAGSASAQSADELVASIGASCVGIYDNPEFDAGDISREQHSEACGCVGTVLGDRDLSVGQLEAIAALFEQDFDKLQTLAGSLSEEEQAGVEEALAAAGETCDPGA